MLFNCKAEVKRLVYEGKVARGKQTIATHPAYLTAVSENSRLMEAGKFGKIYELSITALVDVRESDTIVVDGQEYSVQGLAQRKGWNLALTRVILEKWM